MDTVVLDCGNCGARVADYPREADIPESVARIITGGCPECLAFGPDRYFDGMGRELDPATWRPVSWIRKWLGSVSLSLGSG